LGITIPRSCDKIFFKRSRQRIVADTVRESKKTCEELGIEIQRRKNQRLCMEKEKTFRGRSGECFTDSSRRLRKDRHACYDKLVL